MARHQTLRSVDIHQPALQMTLCLILRPRLTGARPCGWQGSGRGACARGSGCGSGRTARCTRGSGRPVRHRTFSFLLPLFQHSVASPPFFCLYLAALCLFRHVHRDSGKGGRALSLPSVLLPVGSFDSTITEGSSQRDMYCPEGTLEDHLKNQPESRVWCRPDARDWSVDLPERRRVRGRVPEPQVPRRRTVHQARGRHLPW
jgi:hypothetical protein